MGRPAKPTALRLVENGGKMRGRYVERAKREPKGRPGLPPPPAHLNAEQRAIWERLLADSADGLLEHADADLFEGYCVLLAMRNQAARDINTKTNAQILMRSTERHGAHIVNPYLKEYRRLTELLRTLQNDLGYSPVARTRIAVKAATEGADPLERFLPGTKK
jgi:P27 family predicted phage terminase small subunit